MSININNSLVPATAVPWNVIVLAGTGCHQHIIVPRLINVAGRVYSGTRVVDRLRVHDTWSITPVPWTSATSQKSFSFLIYLTDRLYSTEIWGVNNTVLRSIIPYHVSYTMIHYILLYVALAKRAAHFVLLLRKQTIAKEMNNNSRTKTCTHDTPLLFTT